MTQEIVDNRWWYEFTKSRRHLNYWWNLLDSHGYPSYRYSVFPSEAR